MKRTFTIELLRETVASRIRYSQAGLGNKMCSPWSQALLFASPGNQAPAWLPVIPEAPASCFTLGEYTQLQIMVTVVNCHSKQNLLTFNDLKDGNFILVLGAGFSYGVNNQNGEFNTIPTAVQFISLTNRKFTKNTSTYEAAASVWERAIEENDSFLDEFRNLFLVDEDKFDFDLFRNLFIPKWYNIFTFNFDNLAEVTQNRCLKQE